MIASTSNFTKKSKSHFEWLTISIFLFTLFTIPKLNLKIGSVPVYFIDLISVYLIFKYREFYKNVTTKNRVIFFLLIGGLYINQLYYFLSSNDLLYTCYMSFRFTIPLLSLITFYPKIFHQLKYYPKFYVKVLVLSCFISSIIILLFSFQSTRYFIVDLINFKFLNPAAGLDGNFFLKRIGNDNAIRGQSLVGISIISGYFLLLGLGIIFTFLKKIELKHILFFVFCFLCAFLTYSRQIFICCSLIILFFLVSTNSKKISSFVFVFILITIYQWENISTNQNFMFDRIQNTLINVDYDGGTKLLRHSIDERLYSYIKPFEDLQNQPIYFLVGRSITATWSKHNPIYLNLNSVNNPDHSLFGKSFYVYGLMTCLVYMLILFELMKYSFEAFRKKKLMFLFCIPIVIWSLFDHGIITQPHGSMMLFLIYVLCSCSITIKKDEVTC